MIYDNQWVGNQKIYLFILSAQNYLFMKSQEVSAFNFDTKVVVKDVKDNPGF